MQINKTFELDLPVDIVWSGLSDIRLVAECLPGASIGEELPGGGFKGKLTVKLGPLAAAFNGEMSIERREAERVAVVRGKGADPRTNTRVQATMNYSVKPAADAQRSEVAIDSDIALTGALAQFGKTGVMQEVAGHLTAEFARNFTARMAAAHPAAAASASEAAATDAASAATASTAAAPTAAKTTAQEAPRRNELNVVSLMLKILWNRIRSLFGLSRNT